MGSRLLEGSLIVLFYILVNIVATFITTGADDSSFTDACNTTQNVTTCEDQGKATFFSSVADVAVTGFNGAPDIVNTLWVVLGVFMLTVGILLIVVSFIPTTSS